ASIVAANRFRLGPASARDHPESRLANNNAVTHVRRMLDERPITLQEACALYRDTFTPSTLRAEAGRGGLNIFRLGRRDYTTLADLREMVRKCQDDARRRACTSIRDAVTGLSETARASSERAALNQTAIMLKGALPSTSARSTNPRAAT